MRVETNERLARRNRQFAQYLFFATFGILILGLVVHQPAGGDGYAGQCTAGHAAASRRPAGCLHHDDCLGADDQSLGAPAAPGGRHPRRTEGDQQQERPLQLLSLPRAPRPDLPAGRVCDGDALSGWALHRRRRPLEYAASLHQPHHSASFASTASAIRPPTRCAPPSTSRRCSSRLRRMSKSIQ